MLACTPVSIHSGDLVRISCSTELVHVAHGRDLSSLPNLRVANSLHSGDAKNRSKTGVMEALELTSMSRRHAPSLTAPKEGVDDDCLVELDSDLKRHVSILEYRPPPCIELLSIGTSSRSIFIATFLTSIVFTPLRHQFPPLRYHLLRRPHNHLLPLPNSLHRSPHHRLLALLPHIHLLRIHTHPDLHRLPA